jgi:hypothetical protein
MPYQEHINQVFIGSGAQLLTTNEGPSSTSILISPHEQLPLYVVAILSLKVASGLEAEQNLSMSL